MNKDELKEQFSVECTELDTDGSLKVKGSPMDIINWIADKFCLSDVSESVSDENPYLLSGEELDKAVKQRISGY